MLVDVCAAQEQADNISKITNADKGPIVFGGIVFFTIITSETLLDHGGGQNNGLRLSTIIAIWCQRSTFEDR